MALYGPAIFYDGLIQKAGLSSFLLAGVYSVIRSSFVWSVTDSRGKCGWPSGSR